ncbi:MAG: tyrosine-type recombinase/integrase [Gemmatimonadaceae bacterium]
MHTLARADAPALGALADEWLAWIETAGALSPRTRRPYAPRAVERYRVSLNGIFATLPSGRETRTTELTRGALLAFRDARRKDVTGSSINRDLSALQALRRWCADNKGLRFADFSMPKERENAARVRWLTREELDAWLPKVSDVWYPCFLTLLDTRMRVGEALGLSWGDVYMADSRITIGASGRVKTEASYRSVPFSETLAAALVAHARAVPSRPCDPVFPRTHYRYAAIRRAFAAYCVAAEIKPARRHDLRHTYAVHAIQSSVPIPRLQRLLGHASAIMTLRYAAHCPENYFAEDATRIELAMHGPVASSPPTESKTELRRA